MWKQSGGQVPAEILAAIAARGPAPDRVQPRAGLVQSVRAISEGAAAARGRR